MESATDEPSAEPNDGTKKDSPKHLDNNVKDSNKITKHKLTVIGVTFAIISTITALLVAAIPDKSAEYTADLKHHEDSLIHLTNEIFSANKAAFVKYKTSKSKMPETAFKSIVLLALENESNKSKADSLISYLDKVSNCIQSLFCRISNYKINYDKVMYGTWFWLRPYIKETRPFYVKGFGAGLERYAIDARHRVGRR